MLWIFSLICACPPQDKESTSLQLLLTLADPPCSAWIGYLLCITGSRGQSGLEKVLHRQNMLVEWGFQLGWVLHRSQYGLVHVMIEKCLWLPLNEHGYIPPFFPVSGFHFARNMMTNIPMRNQFFRTKELIIFLKSLFHEQVIYNVWHALILCNFFTSHLK